LRVAALYAGRVRSAVAEALVDCQAIRALLAGHVERRAGAGQCALLAIGAAARVRLGTSRRGIARVAAFPLGAAVTRVTAVAPGPGRAALRAAAASSERRDEEGAEPTHGPRLQPTRRSGEPVPACSQLSHPRDTRFAGIPLGNAPANYTGSRLWSHRPSQARCAAAPAPLASRLLTS
jgi:hypothetical protein